MGAFSVDLTSLYLFQNNVISVVSVCFPIDLNDNQLLVE